MTIRKAIRFLLVLLAHSLAFAQGVLTGSPVTGDIRHISLRPKAAETNVLSATLAGGAAADDDNNNSISHPIGGAQYFADPRVAIQETRSHLAWDVAYDPTLRFYVPRSSHRDQFNQKLGGALHYDFSRRLAIGLRQDYLRTSDPFQQFGETSLQSGVGLANRPGLVLFGDFRRTQLISQAEINYRLAKYTTVGVSGDFIQTQGSELSGPQRSLISTHDSLGSAFLSQQISARQSVGVQFQFLDIVFPGRDTRTRTYGVLLFDQIAINQHTTFAVFGGPDYSEIHNQLYENFLGIPVQIHVSSTLWTPSAGAILDWRKDRLGLQASVVRRVSDGGGLLGAVEMNDAVVRFRLKLAPRWVTNLDGQATQHTLLNEPTVGKLQAYGMAAGISYELAHKLWVHTQYQRLQHFGQPTSYEGGNHNRLTLSLERDFSLPIGR